MYFPYRYVHSVPFNAVFSIYSSIIQIIQQKNLSEMQNLIKKTSLTNKLFVLTEIISVYKEDANLDMIFGEFVQAYI